MQIVAIKTVTTQFKLRNKITSFYFSINILKMEFALQLKDINE